VTAEPASPTKSYQDIRDLRRDIDGLRTDVADLYDKITGNLAGYAMVDPDEVSEPLAEWEKQLLDTQERERTFDLIGALAAELGVATGHFAYETTGAFARHDKRMPDGRCAVCALLALARRR
jgi:hypothetical protein